MKATITKSSRNNKQLETDFNDCFQRRESNLRVKTCGCAINSFEELSRENARENRNFFHFSYSFPCKENAVNRKFFTQKAQSEGDEKGEQKSNAKRFENIIKQNAFCAVSLREKEKKAFWYVLIETNGPLARNMFFGDF